MIPSVDRPESLAEELKAISFYFAYLRVVGGCQFTYAAEMRAKGKAHARFAQQQLAEAAERFSAVKQDEPQ